MAEYKSEVLGVSFSVPDEVSVAKQLNFRSQLFGIGQERRLEQFWIAAMPLIEDWQCEKLPDPEALDLEMATDPDLADICHYVGSVVAGHLAALGAVPKNG